MQSWTCVLPSECGMTSEQHFSFLMLCFIISKEQMLTCFLARKKNLCLRTLTSRFTLRLDKTQGLIRNID